MEELLFDSYERPVPAVRPDVQRIPIQHNGEPILYFFDALGYATEDFTLPFDSYNILSLLDGYRSINDIMAYSNGNVGKEDLLNYIKYLDENRILNSREFVRQSQKIEEAYESELFHMATTAGVSYPANPNELITMLNKAFDENEKSESVNSRALYAPHIDPRVGMGSFVKAFSSITHLKPKRVVILATSHYAGMYGDIYAETPFIISDKTFQLPNGSISSSKTFRKELTDRFELDKIGVTFQDRAHRVEHSIELHLLFLNHIWKHNFEVIPILVSSMDELFYTENSYREQQADRFGLVLRTLFEDDPDTFFLISGDLSHVGLKFGDIQNARDMFDEVREHDALFMAEAIKGNPDALISIMKENYDKYRVCGFPPLVTFLKTFPDRIGQILSYDLWDEHERESAVSFGSIAFY
ncbi:MAG: AmmeMemoRadiSam system protein B [Balneolales bacterium]|nr:AmmeMemoRadiSam system protein B [Balneolales bacterium]